MRIVFAGTPEFGAVVLLALLESEHDVVAAYTQPERPAGRGRTLRASPVKMLAEERGIPVVQPATLRAGGAQSTLCALEADVMVVAAYGLLLPREVLALPREGCINVHPSLLPRWRGAAPIQRAILAGDERTGVSIMHMDEGLDTGDILAQSEMSIHEADTAGDLDGRLATLGARLLVRTLHCLPRAKARARSQHSPDARYAARIAKFEARLDWMRSARELDRVVRAMNPSPVAFTTVPAAHGGRRRLRVWRAHPVPGAPGEAPGHVIRASPDEVEVATGEGRLALVEVQAEGARRMPVEQYVNAHPLPPGMVLGLEHPPLSPERPR